jgi:hypothetical protein
MNGTRTGITTLKSLKEALSKLPEDCLISSNAVGNLSVHLRDTESSDFVTEYIGYIDFGNWEIIERMPHNAEIMLQAKPNLFNDFEIE